MECRGTFRAANELPPCGEEGYEDRSKCDYFKPPLMKESMPIFDVYQHCSGVLRPDVFRVMDMVGIDKRDQEFCLNLVQEAIGSLMV